MHNQRPWFITLICVLGAIGVAVSVWALLWPGVAELTRQQVGVWYFPYAFANLIVASVSLVGFWMMRRWGVLLYTGLIIANALLLIFAADDVWNPYSLLIPLIIIVVGFSQYKKMV